MIIDLKIKNFLSFKHDTVFSLLTSSVDDDTLSQNYIKYESVNILKSAVIFGPNASGKSNLLQTMQFLKIMVLKSREFDKRREIKYLPFKLDSKFREEFPIEITLKFLMNTNIYEYAVKIYKNKEVDKNYSFVIESEILIKNDKTIFERNRDRIISDNQNLNKTLVEVQTNKNCLFLSKSEVLGFDDLAEAYSWFYDKLVIDLNSNIKYGFESTIEKMKHETFKNSVIKHLQTADFGNICNVEVKDKEIEFPDDIDETLKKIILKHDKYKVTTFHLDEKDKKIDFDFEIEESQGTRKYFGLLGHIDDMIENGKVFLVDELDKNLHPEILKLIFNRIHESNSHAQIISSTHSFPLLMYVNNSDDEIFRRDQIWFTKKNDEQATELYSLINIGGIRKDLRIFKAYFDGRLDAFPNIT